MLGTKILESKKSKYNGEVLVIKTWGLGTYIQVKGLTQSGGIVKKIWSQTLNRVRKSQNSVNKSLILGLGGGTVAEIISKTWPESKITGVDIDPVIVKMGNKYLNSDNVNVRVFIQDAGKFNTTGYDLVVVDLYLGDKYPEKFEKSEFLKKLTKNKVVVFNRLYYKEKKNEAIKFENKLREVFNNVSVYRPEANIMFICT